MICRQDLIDIIQALAAEEGARQPTAAIWLKDQDEKAVRPAIADAPPSKDAKDE